MENVLILVYTAISQIWGKLRMKYKTDLPAHPLLLLLLCDLSCVSIFVYLRLVCVFQVIKHLGTGADAYL